MEYEVILFVEKAIPVKVKADSEEEAIEMAKNQLINSSEDFAVILDVHID